MDPLEGIFGGISESLTGLWFRCGLDDLIGWIFFFENYFGAINGKVEIFESIIDL